jgi:hypothetical protein
VEMGSWLPWTKLTSIFLKIREARQDEWERDCYLLTALFLSASACTLFWISESHVGKKDLLIESH